MRPLTTPGPQAGGGYPIDSDLDRMTDDGCPLDPDPARWADDPCWLDNLGVWDTFEDEVRLGTPAAALPADTVTVPREATGSARQEAEELWRSGPETRQSAREDLGEPVRPAGPSRGPARVG